MPTSGMDVPMTRDPGTRDVKMRKNQNKFQINQSADVEAQDLSLLKPLPIHDHNLKINCGCGSTRENRKLTDKRLQSGGRAVGTTTQILPQVIILVAVQTWGPKNCLSKLRSFPEN